VRGSDCRGKARPILYKPENFKRQNIFAILRNFSSVNGLKPGTTPENNRVSKEKSDPPIANPSTPQASGRWVESAVSRQLSELGDLQKIHYFLLIGAKQGEC